MAMRFWERQASARRSTRWLLLAFAVCVLLIVASVHLGLSLAWWLLAPGSWGQGGFPRGFLATNIGLTLLFVLGGWWVETDQLRHGGRKLAQRVGAREARPGSSLAEQQLCNIVAEMSIAASMRAPEVVVLGRASAINAFAAGWDRDDAIIAVTQGALDQLTREEMQGLVAHELSHLHEGDTRLNMRLAGMVYGLELIYNFGETMRERDYRWPTLADPEADIFRQYGFRGVPAFVVIDPSGEIRSISLGYTSEIGLRLRLWWASRIAA